ncbi:hypothetical protein EDB86DRAFT_1440369 [Lactarius hatsudake]|nr:hypothetical protein EDB86DRAFT_1440369 [Lactarius hatsudake]
MTYFPLTAKARPLPLCNTLTLGSRLGCVHSTFVYVFFQSICLSGCHLMGSRSRPWSPAHTHPILRRHFLECRVLDSRSGAWLYSLGPEGAMTGTIVTASEDTARTVVRLIEQKRCFYVDGLASHSRLEMPSFGFLSLWVARWPTHARRWRWHLGIENTKHAPIGRAPSRAETCYSKTQKPHIPKQNHWLRPSNTSRYQVALVLQTPAPSPTL